ncbi:MAG: tRNA (guanosine(37)-N1)-methyltransferase TrmD [Bacilli bacterium]|nr:tRNA (guanosine(37)-N1)-methyltransferase TrmD [Bacilli bacterium]
MKITILTLFPEMFNGMLTNSIIKRAISKGVVEIKVVNIRDYTKDKYNRVDTPPIGGGAGLVMKCQPIVDAIRANSNESTHKIFTSPRGRTYNQKIAHEYALKEDLLILCGHYEGVDERVNDYVDELISIGDYILTGGEIVAMAISDSVIRLLDGAITHESTIEESFENNLLEYPQYTEPYDFEGKKIPEVLYSGNHEAIRKYHQRESLILTRKCRKDLFDKYQLTKEDIKLLNEYDSGDVEPKWLRLAIEKGKKFMKE